MLFPFIHLFPIFIRRFGMSIVTGPTVSKKSRPSRIVLYVFTLSMLNSWKNDLSISGIWISTLQHPDISILLLDASYKQMFLSLSYGCLIPIVSSVPMSITDLLAPRIYHAACRFLINIQSDGYASFADTHNVTCFIVIRFI